MVNFSGLHMDMWGEMEMVGADVEMTCCETLNLLVPANAEIVLEVARIGGGGGRACQHSQRACQ